MKSAILAMLLAFVVTITFGQKYVIDNGSVSFFSHAAIEDITAENKKAASIFNTGTGDLVFSIPIHEFQFEKSLMQEHFNEKYMESEKFSKATFQGKITGFNANANGPQQVKAIGKLDIHGVTREVEIPGTIEKQGDKFYMKSKFTVKLVDHKIEIPQLLWQNIAEQVEVTVDFLFKPQ